jgi:hypothetical protein
MVEAFRALSPPRISGEAHVVVRLVVKEIELQRKVKQADGKWNPERRVWEIQTCELSARSRFS